jgi:hypothetical protein
MFSRLFKKKMVSQDDFAAGPYVSIWVGNHRSELDLDEYLGEQFSEDFRFTLDENMMPEISAHDAPQPMNELVTGFSRHEKFRDEFLARAAELGIKEASSIIVFHFLAYSPKDLPIAAKPSMQFVGSFWFGGFE